MQQTRLRSDVVAHGASTPDVKELAKMAQIAVSDKEAEEWQPKINSVIDWFGQLQQVDVTGVTPAIHGGSEASQLRADSPTLHEARAELVAMAPGLDQGYVRVPKITTGADAEAASAAASTAAAAAGDKKAASAPTADVSGPPDEKELAAFGALDIRVGKILECEKHPDADSLYVEKIDVGDEEPRTIVSGLVKYVPLDQMIGRTVIVICNLKPRNMRGIKSHGMVLAASNDEHTVVEPVGAPEAAKIGERVWAGETNELPDPAGPNAVEKKKHWDTVSAGLRSSGECVATWKGQVLNTSAGPLTSGSLAGARLA